MANEKATATTGEAGKAHVVIIASKMFYVYIGCTGKVLKGVFGMCSLLLNK